MLQDITPAPGEAGPGRQNEIPYQVYAGTGQMPQRFVWGRAILIAPRSKRTKWALKKGFTVSAVCKIISQIRIILATAASIYRSTPDRSAG